MKPEHILQSDVLDILFENRNKAYGAYYLRRHSNQNLLKALIAMLFIAGMVIFISTRYRSEAVGGVFAVRDTHSILPLHLLEPVEFEPPPPRERPVPKQAASQHFASIEIVSPSEAIEEPMPDIAAMTDRQVGLATIDAPLSGDIGVVFETGQPGGQDVAIRQDAVTEDTGPHTAASVDEAAEYPGGLKAMMRFLQRYLRHPEEGYDMPRKVSIQFVIARDGSVGNFKVVQSGGEKMDMEVIKVLQKMPRWKPAKKNGRDVAMYFVQPVSFETLQE